jgi:hypothetical protein
MGQDLRSLLYGMSLPELDVWNLRPLDFCGTECTYWKSSIYCCSRKNKRKPSPRTLLKNDNGSRSSDEVTGWRLFSYPQRSDRVTQQHIQRLTKIKPSVHAMNAHKDSRDKSVTHLLGVFAKLRKATISFVTSLRLSARMEQLVFQQKDFQEFDILLTVYHYVSL